MMHDSDHRFRELLASEERLQAFMRHSPVLAFMKDADGRYVYVNPRMEETFGIQLADIKGKADFDWLPAATARTVRENDQRVLATGQTLELVEAIQMPDGSVHQWMVLKFPFTEAGGQRFVGGVAVDITSRIVMEEALTRKEQELRTLLENTPDAVARFDRQLRHVYVNRAAQQLRGLPAERLIGKTLAEAGVSDEERIELEREIRRVFATGIESTFEGGSVTAAGPTHYLVRVTPERDVSGNLTTVLVDSRDITKLKQTEKRLTESERRYRRLFESGLGLMCTHDLDGTLTTVNLAAAQSLGYEPDTLVGTNLRDRLAPDMRKHFDRYLERVRIQGTDDGLMPVLARDGRSRTWKYHNALIVEAGSAPYVLGHAQDVTELKQAQDEAKSLSLTDELTGLHNRRGFLTLAEQQLKLARSRRGVRGCLLVYTDMDGLKHINDRFGHEEGSRAIVAVATLLRRIFRESDIIARLGGDEFVILHLGASSEDVPAMLTRLDEGVRAYNAQGAHPFRLALSVGTAVMDAARGKRIEDLLQEADAAMYEQKRGKDGGAWKI